jgi:hypothetical protein
MIATSEKPSATKPQNMIGLVTERAEDRDAHLRAQLPKAA